MVSRSRAPGFLGYLKTLSISGYNRFISGEFMPKPDAMTAAKKSMENLLPVMNRLLQ